MVCKRVAYYQFRNIEQAALELDRGVNVLYGKNAQGKTNALEGIYLMAQGRSFRMGGESDLIRFGQRQSAVRIWFETDGGEMSLEMRYLQGTAFPMIAARLAYDERQIYRFHKKALMHVALQMAQETEQ